MNNNLLSAKGISRICFGCEPLGGTDWGEVNIRNIQEAIELSLSFGVNFFDTADVYGLGASEERLSKALGSRRHDVVIGTKGGVAWQSEGFKGRAKTTLNGSPEYLYSAIEDSLRRLRIDCIPLYYLHWPDPNIELRRSFEALSNLKNEGKIDLIGCSNLNHLQLELASKTAEVSVIQLHLNYLEGPVDPKIIEICLKENIEIVAYGSLAQGLLTGKFNKNSKFADNDRRSRLPGFKGNKYLENLDLVDKFNQESKDHGGSISKRAISWVLEQPCVVSAISGIKDSSQLEQNCAAIKPL